MPSITPMISAMRLDESLIEAIVPTTSATTSPPLTATSEADTASLLAWWAFSAFCLTVAVSCSIDDAVCSSAAACRSVRADRSMLPLAISPAPLLMVSAPLLTLTIMPTSLSFISCMVSSSRPASPAPAAAGLMRLDRSPAATLRATPTAWCTGRATSARSHSASAAATAASAPMASQANRLASA